MTRGQQGWFYSAEGDSVNDQTNNISGIYLSYNHLQHLGDCVVNILNLLLKATLMKNIFISLLFIILFSGCMQQNGDEDAAGREIITVSIEPFRFFTTAIAGDHYRINVIVPPGASPATYEPPPGVIRDLGDSDLMIINGYLGFELAWMDRIINTNEEIEVLNLSESQDLIAADSHRHGDNIHYTGVDPHFWVSPVRARIIAKDIKDFLISNDPGREKEYNSNYLELDSIIRDTDSYLGSLFDTLDKRSFMIFHPSLSYLAKDYGLEQIAVETGGKEPSPSELKRIIDRGREKDIRTIFIQREFDKRNAVLIGDETGAETVVIDPLSSDWITSVRNIAEEIAGVK